MKLSQAIESFEDVIEDRRDERRSAVIAHDVALFERLDFEVRLFEAIDTELHTPQLELFDIAE